jgi:hypothetical protein
LGCPWKGLLALVGVKTQDLEARSQSEDNDVASRRHNLYFPAEPKAITYSEFCILFGPFHGIANCLSYETS